MDRMLTQYDVEKIAGKEVGIIEYPDLNGIKNIDNILLNGCCLINYEIESFEGHWTCIIKLCGKYYFFDPYGIRVDDEFKYIDKKKMKELGEKYGVLLRLLKGKDYECNSRDYQSWKNGVNTCGRWCGMRMLFSELSNNKFSDLCDKVNMNDKKLTYMTNEIIK